MGNNRVITNGKDRAIHVWRLPSLDHEQMIKSDCNEIYIILGNIVQCEKSGCIPYLQLKDVTSFYVNPVFNREVFYLKNKRVTRCIFNSSSKAIAYCECIKTEEGRLYKMVRYYNNEISLLSIRKAK